MSKFYLRHHAVYPGYRAGIGSVGKPDLASSGPFPAWLHLRRRRTSTIEPTSPASPSLPGERTARFRADDGVFRQSLVFCCFLLGFSAVSAQPLGEDKDLASRGRIESPIVLTQLPANPSTTPGQTGPIPEGPESVASALRPSDYADGARLVMVHPDLSTAVLSEGFHSASDPEISFDASRILFAAKKRAGDAWNIYEMRTDGSDVRRITSGRGDCRNPGYQSTLYTIVSAKPWYQITFVGTETGVLNECGLGMATNLYSCKLDGTAVRRLTFNLSSDMDPFIMPNGRLLLASWQRSTIEHGLGGRISLFGINIDGTDYAAFCTSEGRRTKRMPCATTKGLAIFIEADMPASDGSGSLGCVKLRRPLHSYRPITEESDGLFHSPSPLADGAVLVSRRSRDGADTHGVYRLDPSDGRLELVFDDPGYHDIQAKMLYCRGEPDGRSSVVRDEDPNAGLFCLDVYVSDLKRRQWLAPGTVRRLRVLEGIPPAEGRADTHFSSRTDVGRSSPDGIPPLAQRRILGEIDIEEDGSFNIEIPANTPIELQTLDADGMALRSCSWIWSRNREPRGCIGCHEDGELTPENVLTEAVKRPSVKLTLGAAQRRTVDFRRDIMPIIADRCVKCHGQNGSVPYLTDDFSAVIGADSKVRFNRSYESLLTTGGLAGYGKYVHPGRARMSPLIWHIFGRNTSRPWDETFGQREVPRMPPNRHKALTDDEKRTFAEWIDMGGLWDGIPGPDNFPGHDRSSGGYGK